MKMSFTKCLSVPGLLACLLLGPATLQADTVSISGGQLSDALMSATDPRSGLDALLREKLQQRLTDAGITLEQGALTAEVVAEDLLLRDGCTSRLYLERFPLQVTVAEDSALNFTFNRLEEPIEVDLAINLRVAGSGKVDQELGARLFGDCVRYADDDFTVRAAGTVSVALGVSLLISSEFEQGVGLRLTPELTVSKSAASADINVDVSDTVLSSLIESALEDSLDDQFSAGNLELLTRELEAGLRDRLKESLDGDSFLLTLDNTDEEILQSVYSRVVDDVGLPITFDYFQQNQSDILLAWLSGEDTLNQLLVAAACDAASLLLIDMPHAPLYRRDGAAQCVLADLDRVSSDERLFLDAACSNETRFQATGLQTYCAETLDRERFGDATSLIGAEPYWTLNPATRLDIGINSIAGLDQPFMLREGWRQISNDRGVCTLEMRVFKPAIDAVGLKPMLMLHGGSWRFRSAGYPAQEALVAHYTDAGYAVFAPFYRLADDKEALPACHLASADDILDDAGAALEWVQSNAERFGASREKVTVTGQSAGAYLAASLAITQADTIERALLFYAPTDIADFVSQVNVAGVDADPQGISAIEALLGRSLEETTSFDADVVNLSLPQQAENLLGRLPPMFMMQGGSDALVPARQSVRLCNALSGSVGNGAAMETAGDPESGVYSQVYACDDQGSELHLIAEADHALDVCFLGVECPAGGVESQQATRNVLKQSMQWLTADQTVVAMTVPDVPADNPATNVAPSGGGGSIGWAAFCLALLAFPLRIGRLKFTSPDPL